MTQSLWADSPRGEPAEGRLGLLRRTDADQTEVPDPDGPPSPTRAPASDPP